MKTLLLSVCALFLSACETFGLNTLGIDPERIDTANKQLIVRAAEVDGFTTLARTLFREGVITANQAQLVYDRLNEAGTLIEEATAALEVSGNPLEAETKLDQISTAISLALALLNSFAPDETATLERNFHVNSRLSGWSQRHQHYSAHHTRLKWHSGVCQLA